MGLPRNSEVLFTDLEGSTRLWEAHPQEMRDALARHNTIVRAAVESHNGIVFSTMGDGMAAVFARPAMRFPECWPRRLSWQPRTGVRYGAAGRPDGLADR